MAISTTAHPILHELSVLTRYAAPVVCTQFGMMLMGVVDAWMVGKLGHLPLASVALGDTWIMGTFILGMGILHGIDPIVSQAHGARDGESAALALQRGIVLAFLLTLPVGACLLYTESVMRAAGQDPQLAAGAQAYTEVQVLSIAPYFVFVALRQYLHGRAMMTPTLWVVAIANGLNLLFDWILIFGNLGFPVLGIEGAGIATALTRSMMMILLLAWILRFGLYRDAWVPWSRAAFDLRGLRQIFAYGVPIGIQFSLEIWAFALAALVAGHLGALPLASHFIVIRLASLSFMVPLGISIATTTRVGNLIGAGEPRRAQRAAWVALGMGAGTMTISALVFIVFREWLPGQFSVDADVVVLCASILPVAATFQLFDGTQVVGCGILRGMGDTVPAAIANLLGYYILALPFGWWLTFGKGLGLEGVWWGLCFGLGVVAVILIVWIWRRGPAYGLGPNSYH